MKRYSWCSALYWLSPLPTIAALLLSLQTQYHCGYLLTFYQTCDWTTCAHWRCWVSGALSHHLNAHLPKANLKNNHLCISTRSIFGSAPAQLQRPNWSLNLYWSVACSWSRRSEHAHIGAYPANLKLHQRPSTISTFRPRTLMRGIDLQISRSTWDDSSSLLPYGKTQLSASQLYWQGEAFDSLLIDLDLKPSDSTLYGASFWLAWRQNFWSSRAI